MTHVYRVEESVKRNFFSKFSVNTILISFNVILFIVFSVWIAIDNSAINFIALKPANILGGVYLWTLLTSIFMHAGIAHLFFNMFSLMFVGGFVEKIIGKKRYIWFFILSGIFAGLFFVLLSGFFGGSVIGEKLFGNSNISGVGASGVIFALVGLLAVLIPQSKVFLILGPLLAIILDASLQFFFPGNPVLTILSFFISLYLFVSIFSMFSFNSNLRKISIPVEMPLWFLPIAAIVPLVIIGFFVPLPIGNTAHLGGLIFGLAYGIYLKIKYKKKTAILRRHFA